MVDIEKIFKKELKKYCSSYYDYNDSLTSSQIIDYIQGNFIDDIINYDYIDEQINNLINGLSIKLTETEKEKLKDLCSINWDINLQQLFNNKSYYLVRLELHGNEDAITLNDYEKSTMYKAFTKQYGYKKEFKKLVLNTPCDYALITIPLKINSKDINRFKKEWEKGKITIQKGTNIILFNSWIGSGSLNEIILKKPIVLKTKKWFSDKYAQVKIRQEETEDKYNIQSVYSPTSSFFSEY